MIEDKIKKYISFFLKFFLLLKKKTIIPIIKMIVFISLPSGKKKFKITAIKDKIIQPTIALSLILLNLFVYFSYFKK
jgi:hypothetical protein